TPGSGPYTTNAAPITWAETRISLIFCQIIPAAVSASTPALAEATPRSDTRSQICQSPRIWQNADLGIGQDTTNRPLPGRPGAALSRLGRNRGHDGGPIPAAGVHPDRAGARLVRRQPAGCFRGVGSGDRTADRADRQSDRELVGL